MTVDIPATRDWGMLLLASLLASIGALAMKNRV